MHSELDLERYEQLEKLVEQRTAELASVNEALRAEIAEHQRTEATLRQTHQTLHALVAASPRAIFTLNLEGQVYTWNPAAEGMFGWSEAEVLARANPILPMQIVENYLQLWQSGQQKVPPIELHQVRKDGSRVDIRLSAAPIRNNQEQIHGLVAVVEDLTEHRHLDEARLALEKEREVGTLKNQFFAMASHEFRTPLSTILAATQLLEGYIASGDSSDNSLRNTYRISTSVKHMIQLLDDFLTLNRAETDPSVHRLEPLNLETLCRQFIEEMRLQIGTKHRITFCCSEALPEVQMDEKLLRSMLTNLLSNAIKYSPQGGEVAVRLSQKENQIYLEVQDPGIGIPIDEQSNLFKPFFRSRNVHNIPGTGLGLAVVKKCVDILGGTITCTTVLGEGSTFTLCFPGN